MSMCSSATSGENCNKDDGAALPSSESEDSVIHLQKESRKGDQDENLALEQELMKLGEPASTSDGAEGFSQSSSRKELSLASSQDKKQEGHDLKRKQPSVDSKEDGGKRIKTTAAALIEDQQAVGESCSEEFDIGIPEGYRPSEAPTSRSHLTCIAGLLNGLQENLSPSSSSCAALDMIRRVTGGLVAFQVPLSSWNAIAQKLLRHLRRKEQLERERDKEDVAHRCKAGELEPLLVVIQQHEASLRHQRARLSRAESAVSSLQRQQAILTKQLKQIDEEIAMHVASADSKKEIVETMERILVDVRHVNELHELKRSQHQATLSSLSAHITCAIQDITAALPYLFQN